MSQHSVERCFKVHAYPLDFKFKYKKIVIAVSVNFENRNDSKTNYFSQAQYSQFLEMYNKQNFEFGSHKQGDKSNDSHYKL